MNVTERVNPQAPAVTVRASLDPELAMRAFPLVASIKAYYPGFEEWYEARVIPDLSKERGRMVVAEHGADLVGVAFGKVSPDEVKLRCLFVDRAYRGRSVGHLLMSAMFKELGTDKPMCSVCEEMFPTVAPLFVNRYGFVLTRILKGIYRPGKLEYVFNGERSR